MTPPRMAGDVKSRLRRAYRQRRDALGPERVAEDSRRIAERLLALPELRRVESVFAYVSTGSEVQTHDLIDALLDSGKTVLVPRLTTTPGQMAAVPITSRDQLVPARHGLLEPPPDLPAQPGTPDVTLVPGLAFDPLTGLRLGMGGGYYDRYLAAHLGTLPVALAFDLQLCEQLSAQPHDVPCRLIVTESRPIRPFIP